MKRIEALEDITDLPMATLTIARLLNDDEASPELHRSLGRLFATWTGWPAGAFDAEDRAVLPSLWTSVRSGLQKEGRVLEVTPGAVMAAGGMDMGGGFALVTKATIIVHDFRLGRG